MDRRDFLKLSGGVSAAGLAPEMLWAAEQRSAHLRAKKQRPTTPPAKRKLVLVRLKGGNDGLNTLIPFSQYDHYRELRPTISMPAQIKKLRSRVLDNSGMSLNPYMHRLDKWFDAGDVAWIQGVGYARPVLSHFESSDVWDTAMTHGRHANKGWLAHLLPRMHKNLHGVVLGDELGPMHGKDCHAIAMKSPEVFLSQITLLDEVQPSSTYNPALAHLTNIQSQVLHAKQEFEQKMRRPTQIGGRFANSAFGRQLESVAKMIINDIDAPVYMVELDGFDTHVDQLNQQNHNLSYLSDALDSFATALKQHGHWDNVLVMTYSEFGRRVKENHGRGTDHGAASVQLVMGGAVRGGVYGRNPDLKRLDAQGNLPMTTDFRKVYSTVAQRWMRQPSPWAAYGTLPFV